MIAPIIEELSNELHGQAVIAKIDIDKNQGTPSAYGVTSIPTIIIFKDGQEIQRVVGVRDKESLKKLVTAAF
jgi:thioredoxin 1